MAQLGAISSPAITCNLSKETKYLLTATSFRVVVESDEVSLAFSSPDQKSPSSTLLNPCFLVN